MSEWEQWDYEWTVFKEILDEAQFKQYETDQRKHIKRVKKGLIESDKEYGWQITYSQEWLQYFETKVLPPILEELPDALSIFYKLQSKIDYLKSEYRTVLNELRAETLLIHCRFSRTLRPNMLKLSLLQIKHYYLWPDYFFFKHKADEPTKAVAEFLESKLDYFSEKFVKLVTTTMEELTAYNQTLMKKHYPKPHGWLTQVGPPEVERHRINELMGLLLLDKDQYGWNPSLLR